MLIDACALRKNAALRADVCIVGGGAAGLTLAHELGRSARVVVVESGGLTPDSRAQRLHEGTIDGSDYYPLDTCRVRALGGTTTIWGGWCRPLDGIDFEPRDAIPESGWPITKEQLDPFYERAHRICRLGPFRYDAAAWHRADRTSVLRHDDGFEETLFQIQPTRFGEVYGASVATSRNVDVVVNATALGLAVDPTAAKITAVRAASLDRASSIRVSADVFVLAAGGIENARLLLVSAADQGGGITNEHDLVGRYFAEHLHVPLGQIVLDREAAEFFSVRLQDGVRLRGAIVPTERWRRNNQGPGFAVTLHNADDPHDVLSIAQTGKSYASLAYLLSTLRRRRLPHTPLRHVREILARPRELSHWVYRRVVKPKGRTFFIGCRAEQAPNRTSRVTLDRSCDAFGVPRARLNWKISTNDLETLARAQERIANAFGRERVQMFPATGDGGWQRTLAAGAHHIGTTRMNADAQLGVVDEHCRVHGTHNLYVAGSSVFPTAGWAPPTLTIVALAVRLADHLARASVGHED